MPPKIDVDENLVFLYRCLLNSDCKNIDFNAVGSATNLKANAARMRYSRLKKNIESMIDGSSKKRSTDSIEAQTTNKIKLTTTPSKKRKPMYQSEDEEFEYKTLHDEIGSVMIKDEELQEWTGTPRTRGKKIDFKDVFDTDSSTGSGLHNRHGESSDDYKMEDVSEEDEELRADEDGMEIDLPASPRRKSNSQSANKTISTKRSSITASTKSSNENPGFVANNDGEQTAAKPKVPGTPESGIPGPKVTKRIRSNLPPMPQSMPNDLKKQETMDSSSIIPETGIGTERPVPTPRSKKMKYTTPESRLVKHVERALKRADQNFAAQARQADKIPQIPIYDEKIHDERFLQAIGADEEDEEEHGQEEEDDMANLDTSSNFSSPYHSLNPVSATSGDDEADAVSEVATRTELNGSSATPAPDTTTMLWSTTTATTPAAAIAPSTTQLATTIMQQSPSSPPDSCIVQ